MQQSPCDPNLTVCPNDSSGMHQPRMQLQPSAAAGEKLHFVADVSSMSATKCSRPIQMQQRFMTQELVKMLDIKSDMAINMVCGNHLNSPLTWALGKS